MDFLGLGERCIAGSQGVGKCVTLEKCHQIVQDLEQSQNSNSAHERAIDIVRELHCGFSYEQPLICCPHHTRRGSNSNKINSFEGTSTNLPNLGSTNLNDGKTSQAPNITSATLRPAQLMSSDRMIFTNQNTIPNGSPAQKMNRPKEVASSRDNQYINEIRRGRGREDIFEDCGRVLSNRYFQGYETDLGDFTSLALIGYNTPKGKVFECGGSLISDKFVVTAAQCTSFTKPGMEMTDVRLGEYNFATEIDCIPDNNDNSTYCADKFVDIPIEEVISYPGALQIGYNHAHDIALIRLANKVTFTKFIQPICLPAGKPVKQKLYTSGWGTNNNGDESNLKYMSILSMTDKRSCRKMYARVGVNIYDRQICAGSGFGEKPCVGDIGGPIMGIEKRPDNTIRMMVFGILTAVYPSPGICYPHGWPGIYTEIGEYVTWIKSEIWQREKV
ncbi:hypothetical protein QAD02_005223 [Eretmocerus hayati]|uniref:Uncharacterized protein n=1 Tax=Eretmocerus hayati TaxID=131215 RepID=A0ACC2NTM4_9HYME|nr:hypothetical protein QAD02_005223 [Eretmocerus hayati]